MNKLALALVVALVGTSAYGQSPTTSTTTERSGGPAPSQGGRAGGSIGVESRETGTSVRTRTETEEPSAVTRRRSTTVTEETAAESRSTASRLKRPRKTVSKARRGKAVKRSSTVQEACYPPHHDPRRFRKLRTAIKHRIHQC